MKPVQVQYRIAKVLPALLLLIPALTLLSGCAGIVKQAQQAVAALFQLNPTSVNFGTVTVGKKTTQNVSVTNTGTVSVNITQATFSNSQFALSGTTLPMALGVAQSGSLSVVVTPTAAGNVSGTLTVTGDGGSTPATVALSANAVGASQPQISLSQSSINFGTVSVGSTGNSSLVISNLGSAPLTVSVIGVTGAGFAVSGVTTPATINPSSSATLGVTFTPAAASAASGSITITSNDPTNPTLAVPLSGTGSNTAAGQLSASPASVNFGSVAVGGSSGAQQIVVSNTGTAAVNITAVVLNGSVFAVTGATAPVTVNPSSSITLSATFSPTTSGSASGSITITSSASNPSLSIALSGTGTQAGLSVSPASFNFGSVADGQTKSETFTVTNTGTASLTISQIGESGGAFSVSGLATPATIPAGGTTTFSVLFDPTTAGSLTGSVSITSSAPSSPTAVALSGTGTAAAPSLTASPTSLSFPSIAVGNSGTQTVTITNNGTASATISAVTVNAKDFSSSGIAAGLTIGAGQSAAMSVVFSPSASENITGNITVMSAQGSTAVVTVSGSGIQPALTITPSSANFGNVTIGSPSTQPIQLTNSGTATLTITGVTASGTGFSTSSLSLPISLAAGHSSSFNVQFSPASAGAASGSVTVASNAPNSPATIPLSGTGVAQSLTLSFNPTSLSFGNVNTGSSSTLPVTATNTGNGNVQITQISENGTGFSLTNAGTPVTLTPNQTMTFSVVFSPTTAATDSGTVTVASTATGSPATISLTGTGVQAATYSVTLNWTASTSTVSGYNVYRSTTNGSGYAKINPSLVSAVTYSDSTVQDGTTYYYVTTAVNSSGTESAYSNQATAVIP